MSNEDAQDRPKWSCPRCPGHKPLSQIAQHMNSAHPFAIWSEEEAGLVGVAACPCGRVVPTVAGLKRHRYRSMCSEYVRLGGSVPPLAAQPALASTVVASVAPSWAALLPPPAAVPPPPPLTAPTPAAAPIAPSAAPPNPPARLQLSPVITSLSSDPTPVVLNPSRPNPEQISTEPQSQLARPESLTAPGPASHSIPSTSEAAPRSSEVSASQTSSSTQATSSIQLVRLPPTQPHSAQPSSSRRSDDVKKEITSPPNQESPSAASLVIRIRSSSAASLQTVQPRPSQAVSQPAVQSSTLRPVASLPSLSLSLLREGPSSRSSPTTVPSSSRLSAPFSHRDRDVLLPSRRATMPAGTVVTSQVNPDSPSVKEEGTSSQSGLLQELADEARKKVEEQKAQLKREREELWQRQIEEVEKEEKKRKRNLEDLMKELEGLDEELERIMLRKEVVKQAIMQTARG